MYLFQPRNLVLLLSFSLLLAPFLQAQTSDSLRHVKKWHQRQSFRITAVPLTLTALAMTTLSVKPHTSFSKYSIQNELLMQPRMFETSVDDHLRNVPIGLVYGLNAVGIKGKNNFAERTIILSKILLIQHLVTTGMKRGFQVARPGGDGNSFPSAHTSRAFAAAAFMHHEYKHISPWYGIAGYSFAVATAALRFVNNHHWLPDVLVGAGLGILTTNLVYLTHRHQLTKWLNNGKKGSKLVLAPSINNGATGFYMRLKL